MESAANTTSDKADAKDQVKEAVCDEFKFARSWTLWEHYETAQGSKQNYNSQMGQVCSF